MKLRAQRAPLAEAARLAARHLASRPTELVYSALRLQAGGEKLAITGFDGDVLTRTTLGVDVLESGSALIPGLLLADILGRLAGDEVEFAEVPQGVQLTCGQSSYLLGSLDHLDYPRLPVAPEPSGVVAGDLLARAVTAVAPASDPANPLPGLTGIQILPRGRQLAVRATNRYRVAEYVIDWEPLEAANGPVLVPTHHLVEASKGLALGDVVLSLPADGRSAALQGPGRAVVLRAIDAQFPDVDRVFPSEFSAVLEVDAQELAAAVSRLSRVAEDKTPLKLDIAVDSLAISAATGTTVSATERLECQLEGPEHLRLAFQPHYLRDALAAFDGAAQFGIPAWNKPILVSSPDEGPYRHLVMPVRHDWAKPEAA